eukprot:PhF_6_TR33850/c0_g1_i1/m.49647
MMNDILQRISRQKEEFDFAIRSHSPQATLSRDLVVLKRSFVSQFNHQGLKNMENSKLRLVSPSIESSPNKKGLTTTTTTTVISHPIRPQRVLSPTPQHLEKYHRYPSAAGNQENFNSPSPSPEFYTPDTWRTVDYSTPGSKHHTKSLILFSEEKMSNHNQSRTSRDTFSSPMPKTFTPSTIEKSDMDSSRVDRVDREIPLASWSMIQCPRTVSTPGSARKSVKFSIDEKRSTSTARKERQRKQNAVSGAAKVNVAFREHQFTCPTFQSQSNRDASTS